MQLNFQFLFYRANFSCGFKRTEYFSPFLLYFIRQRPDIGLVENISFLLLQYSATVVCAIFQVLSKHCFCARKCRQDFLPTQSNRTFSTMIEVIN